MSSTPDPRTVAAVATLLGPLLDAGDLDDATVTRSGAAPVAHHSDRVSGASPRRAPGLLTSSPASATHGAADTSPKAATVHPGAAALTRGGLATETQAPHGVTSGGGVMLTLLALCGWVVLLVGLCAVACCILSSLQSRAEQGDPAADQRAQDAARATAAACEAAFRDGHQGDW